MKKVTYAVLFAFIIISICMFYLIRNGISLRTSPVIQPSEISLDEKNIATGVVQRLFQQFQDAHYILWGVLPKNEKTQKVIELIQEEYKKVFKQSVNLIEDAEQSTLNNIHTCQKPCWIFMSEVKAHQLGNNDFIQKNILSSQKHFFTLTILSFKRDLVVEEECNIQKRLGLACLISVSVREVHRKIKDPNKRYFFLRGYNDSDFFLFIEN